MPAALIPRAIGCTSNPESMDSCHAYIQATWSQNWGIRKLGAAMLRWEMPCICHFVITTRAAFCHANSCLIRNIAKPWQDDRVLPTFLPTPILSPMPPLALNSSDFLRHIAVAMRKNAFDPSGQWRPASGTAKAEKARESCEQRPAVLLYTGTPKKARLELKCIIPWWDHIAILMTLNFFALLKRSLKHWWGHLLFFYSTIMASNYAEYFGIESIPAAAVFAALYAPFLAFYVYRSIRRTTYVFLILSLFCTSKSCRKLLAMYTEFWLALFTIF